MAGVNCEKFKGKVASHGIMGHCTEDTRLENEHNNKHIDKTCTKENRAYGAMGTYAEACEAYDRRIEELDSTTNRNRRKDRVTLLGTCIPAPKGMMPQTARHWFAEVYQIAQDVYGKENVIGATEHWDEIHDYLDSETGEMRTSRAHLHVYSVPEKDGQLNARSVCSKKTFNELNNRIQKMTREHYQYDFMDGSKKKSYASVEELKHKSEKLQEQAERTEVARGLKRREHNVSVRESKLNEREDELNEREEALEQRANALQRDERALLTRQKVAEDEIQAKREELAEEYEKNAQKAIYELTEGIQDAIGKAYVRRRKGGIVVTQTLPEYIEEMRQVARTRIRGTGQRPVTRRPDRRLPSVPEGSEWETGGPELE